MVHIIVEREYNTHFGWCLNHLISGSLFETNKKVKNPNTKEKQVPNLFSFKFYFRLKCISLKMFYNIQFRCSDNSQLSIDHESFTVDQTQILSPSTSHNEPENTTLGVPASNIVYKH